MRKKDKYAKIKEEFEKKFVKHKMFACAGDIWDFIVKSLNQQRKEAFEDGYATGLLDGKKTCDEMLDQQRKEILREFKRASYLNEEFVDFTNFLADECFDEKEYGECKYDKKIWNYFIDYLTKKRE